MTEGGHRMYILERLVGVVLYCLVLLICLVALSVSKKSKVILFIYSMALSVMAYFYVPSKSADLYRIFGMMEYYVSFPFNEILDLMSTYETPLALLYYYFIGKTGLLNLLPALTALIYYGNIFSVISKVQEKYKLNGYSTAIIVLFVMSFGQYIQVISGIRTMLAFSIIAKCVYQEFFEQKPLIFNFWKYIIAMLFHQAAIVVVVTRILYELFLFNTGKSRSTTVKVGGILIIVFLGIRYGNRLFNTVLLSATHYLTSNVYFFFWEFLLTFIHIILIIILMHRYKKVLKSESSTFHIYRYVSLMLIIDLIFMFEYNTFQRFAVMISMLVIPILGKIFKHIQDNNTMRFSRNTTTIVIIFSIIILAIACLRGNLSALKFFQFI